MKKLTKAQWGYVKRIFLRELLSQQKLIPDSINFANEGPIFTIRLCSQKREWVLQKAITWNEYIIIFNKKQYARAIIDQMLTSIQNIEREKNRKKHKVR